jgi:hypothetical protein
MEHKDKQINWYKDYPARKEIEAQKGTLIRVSIKNKHFDPVIVVKSLNVEFTKADGITPLEVEHYHSVTGTIWYRFLSTEKEFLYYTPKSKLDRCIDKMLECS